ncbi:BRISC complex subunit FAM175B-like [Aricia agestis]|uniref:BRISC complex subunit FAM175B-like n=1 Tax=Aricia agestis TaxID=91739 RepID=UPI001C208304|nr:BRISC complex subunit FAM175B-like [Aricia agestis]
MAYTEKVLLSGTALSFLFYECLNSDNSQEGFLLGDISSRVTNHISDSQNDNPRLDTQILVRSVLPLPSASLFYLPTGKLREDVLSEILAQAASDVVGWYKYRKNTSIKPTFRDKNVSKGLQRYFEKYQEKKTFVSCFLSSKESSASSTHTIVYKFGKINCFDYYEYIEDVTGNLGEKVTGYKKAQMPSAHCIFNRIVKESNVHTNNTNDAIMLIQKAVDERLTKEAKIAAKNECTIRELENEIKEMTKMLCERQCFELQEAYETMIKEKTVNRQAEMAQACIEAMKTPTTVDILSAPNIIINNSLSGGEKSIHTINTRDRSPSPILSPSTSSNKAKVNYASIVKKKSEQPSSSTTANEDLIIFDVEDKQYQKPIIINDNVSLGGSSPEY